MKYPIGIQDFKQLREGGFVYIDKTDFALQLMELGQPLFLTRPRRFGKSLLLSTIKYAYLGEKQLFEGLKIYDNYDFKPFPVLHLDFSEIKPNLKLKLDFESRFLAVLYEYSKEIAFPDETGDVALQFKGILKFLRAKNQKLVLIIDEYDKPLVDNLDNIPIARKNQLVLRSFYEIVKAQGADLEFLIITGITKFSQLSLFSSMNQLFDFSFAPQFAHVCGYTQKEIDAYLPDFYTNLQDKFPNQGVDVVRAYIKEWHNGYNFGSAERIYNPFAILNIAQTTVFKNYWYESGNPRWLFNLMRENMPYDLINLEVRGADIRSFDIENINFETVLFQTGYLTIQSHNPLDDSYILDFPNREVKECLYDGLLTEYAWVRSGTINKTLRALKKATNENDLEAFFHHLNILFASVPHQIFLEQYEAFYHAILHIAFTLLNYHIDSEVSTNIGRIDTVLQTATHIYIIEFKIDKPVKNAIKTTKKTSKINPETIAGVAMQQIKDKKYAEKYLNSGKQIVLIGVCLGREERGVTAYIDQEI